MNTIRRKITKSYACLSDPLITQHDTIVFEGEKEKFNIEIEHFNPFEGTSRASIALNKSDAEILYKSLSNFLK